MILQIEDVDAVDAVDAEFARSTTKLDSDRAKKNVDYILLHEYKL